jgi:aspartyl-tRNA(Asn)/glutamyl-tRNA(Gln) amidotransferase subunit A
MMSDLTQLTITEAASLLDKGEISSVELTQAHLDRIVRVDSAVQAYLLVTSDIALKQAEAADQRRLKGDRTPLLGIPVAYKDIFTTEGVITTCGSRILENYRPPYTATAVRRLEEVGAVMLGKLNMDEFAMGSSTENSGYQLTYNPWNLDRVPGGSSGGSTAAVAARTAMGALGTDTGGSIRLPASFCGVVGLKPSYGRVSRYGMVAYASSLDQAGPLTRSVADAALMLNAITGHDPQDSTTMNLTTPDFTGALKTDLKGLRVGFVESFFSEGMQPAVEAAVRAAIVQLESLGAEIKPVALPTADYALPIYYLVATAECSANLARFDGVRYGPRGDGDSLWDTYLETRGQGFGAEVKRRIMLGTFVLRDGYIDAYYVKAQKARTLVKRDFEKAFADVDVIAGPVAPTTAFKMGDRVDDPLQMYLTDIFTIPVNLAGMCGLSVPCGFDSEGLPIGLHLMGPAFGEENILHAAYAYEQSVNWQSFAPDQV